MDVAVKGKDTGQKAEGLACWCLLPMQFFCKFRLLGSTRVIKVLADLSHSLTATEKSAIENRYTCKKHKIRLTHTFQASKEKKVRFCERSMSPVCPLGLFMCVSGPCA